MVAEEKQIRLDQTRHQRALRDTRDAPTRKWAYGLFGLDLVLVIISAIVAPLLAADGQPIHIKVLVGLVGGVIAFLAGLGLFVGGTYVWYWWDAPMRMLEETRDVVLQLVGEVLEARNLTDLIESLKRCQSDTMVILGRLAFQGQHIDQETFDTWNGNLETLMREAGDEHYARYAARIVKVTVPPQLGMEVDMRTVYQDMIAVLTDTITDLSVKREQARARAREQASESANPR